MSSSQQASPKKIRFSFTDEGSSREDSIRGDFSQWSSAFRVRSVRFDETEDDAEGLHEDSSTSTASPKEERIWSTILRTIGRSSLPGRHKRPALNDDEAIENTQRRDIPLLERDETPIGEFSPLLHQSDQVLTTVEAGSSTFKETYSAAEKRRAVDIGAIFLIDYEKSRPPSLVSDIPSISSDMLALHNLRSSFAWITMTRFALFALFISSCLEGYLSSNFIPFSLNIYAILVFGADVILWWRLQRPDLTEKDTREQVRTSRARHWIAPLLTMLSLLGLEMWMVAREPRFLWASVLKPVAIFYISQNARSGLEALRRIAPIVGRVILMELLLILSFAAVACRLYNASESFHDLSTSWLSLFQCKFWFFWLSLPCRDDLQSSLLSLPVSTTVVNPSMWMEMYNENRDAAFFFVLFVSTTTFYVHSLGKFIRLDERPKDISLAQSTQLSPQFCLLYSRPTYKLRRRSMSVPYQIESMQSSSRFERYKPLVRQI